MRQSGIQALGTLPVHDHSALVQGGQINNDDLFQAVGVYAYRNGVQAIGNAAVTKVLFETELYDIGGDFDADGVDSNFIVPSTGYYFITANILITDIADGKIYYTYVYVDGGEVASNYRHSGLANSLSGGVSTLRRLTAAQVVDIRVYHNHGVNRNIGGGSTNNYVSIFKRGA